MVHSRLNVAGRGVVEALERRAYLSGHAFVAFAPPASFPAGVEPSQVHAGDFNSDHKLDLVIGSSTQNAITLLPGNGDGTFGAPITIPLSFTPFIWSAPDVNGDGKPDLLVSDVGGGELMLMLGHGDGTFAAPTDTGLPAGPLALGDFNGDGKLDIATITRKTTALHLAFGNGDGTFNRQPDVTLPATAESVQAIDTNGTGLNALALAGPDDLMVWRPDDLILTLMLRHTDPYDALAALGIVVYLGLHNLGQEGLTVPDQPEDPVDPNETFNSSALHRDVAGLTTTAAATTYPRDLVILAPGQTDAFISQNLGGGRLGPLRDAGPTGRTRSTFPVPVRSVQADLNGDGLSDLAYVDTVENSVGILPRVSEFKFGAPVTLINGDHVADCAIYDVNGDGLPDVVVSDDSSNTVQVFLNRSPSSPTSVKDLTPTITAKVPPAGVIAGQKTTFTPVVDIRNTNVGVVSGKYTLTLYASADQTVDSTATTITSVATRLTLGAGQHKGVKIKVGRFPAIADGSYNLIARLTDAAGLSKDAVLDMPVTIRAPFIDLSGAFVGMLRTPLAAGQKTTAVLSVTNSGNVAVSKSIFIGIVARNADDLSPDVTIPPVKVTLKLQPLATRNLKLKIALPKTIPPGTYNLVAMIDSTDLLSESQKGNNTVISATTFTVS